MTKPPFSLLLPLPPSFRLRCVFIVRSIFKCIVDVHRHVPPNFNFTLRAKGFTFWFFSLFFLFWLCFVYWTTWDSWLSVVVVVVVGVADTRNFVCGDDSFPLYASISVSLGRGWWGRLEGTGGTSCCELVFHNKPSQPPMSHFVRHHANAPKQK